MNIGLLFRGDFTGGQIAWFGGIGSVVWDGVTYTGVGDLIRIGQSASTLDDSQSGLSVTLSGIAPEVIYIAENEEFQRRRVRIYTAQFDAAGAITTATLFFDGLADDLTSNDDPANPVVSLTCEQRQFDLRRPRPFKYLPEDQKRRFPGDTGFDLVADIQTKDDIWGRGDAA